MTNHQHDTGDAAMAEMLDLDAEVLHAYLSELTGWIQEHVGDPAPRRILDVGSGTGTGTFALLARFEKAEVTALDLSAPLLHHLQDKARALGVAERVRTVEADLDEAWPATPGGAPAVDLAWASASLHHMADPDRALAEVFAALRPGGLLAAVELDSFPRFLPDDLGIGRPGLEARCHAAMDAERTARVPHLGSDWGPRLTGAGFTLEAERTFTIDLTSPLPASAGRYAQVSLNRMRAGMGGGLDGWLDGGDLATLDALLDDDGPHSIRRRDDLTVRATRTVWLARRP